MSNPPLSDRSLEQILRAIELPGEDPELLRRYLDNGRFVERVMSRIRMEAERSQKVAAWALFALIDLILLVIVGSNNYLVVSYFAMQETLSQFFYLFLGISFLGALFGLVLSSDTTWVESLPRVLQPLCALRRLLARNGHPK